MASAFSRLMNRSVRRGLITAVRERSWGAAISALMGMFLLFQLLALLFVSMNALQTLLKSDADIRVELLHSSSVQQKQEFIAALQQDSSIGSVVYITKEQALIDLKKSEPQMSAFLEEFSIENPFPDSVIVTLNSLDTYDSFHTALKSEQWAEVVDASSLGAAGEQEQHIRSLLNLTAAGQFIAALFMLLTGGILLIVTVEMIRNRVISRTEEILVEHLSGAHTLFIVMPFIIEAVFLLLIALLCSVVLFVLVLMLLPMVIPGLQQSSLSFLGQQIITLVFKKLPLLVLVELLIVPFLAIAGAWLGVLPKVNTRALALHR